MDATPTSAPGSSAAFRGGRAARGFTLVELLLVVAIIAIASAVATIAMRDPAATRLEREGERLATLLEAARAEARASGVAARWELDDSGFHFAGLPTTVDLPQHWLGPDIEAEIVGARAVSLGPEPLIGAQRILLQLDDQRIAVATDGLSPFAVEPAPVQ
jgi:general secretion pathway protein H